MKQLISSEDVDSKNTLKYTPDNASVTNEIYNNRDDMSVQGSVNIFSQDTVPEEE